MIFHCSSFYHHSVTSHYTLHVLDIAKQYVQLLCTVHLMSQADLNFGWEQNEISNDFNHGGFISRIISCIHLVGGIDSS